MIAAAQRLARLARLPFLALALLLLSLAACETPHGSVAGGASSDHGGGHIQMGWPF